jgi:hypothetical protein
MRPETLAGDSWMAPKRNLVLTDLEQEQADKIAAALRAAKGVGADEMARRIAGESPGYDRNFAAAWLEKAAKQTMAKALRLWPSSPERERLMDLAKDMRRDAGEIRKGAAFRMSTRDGILTVTMGDGDGRVIDVDARE